MNTKRIEPHFPSTAIQTSKVALLLRILLHDHLEEPEPRWGLRRMDI